MNVIKLATCFFGEKTLDVLNTKRRIFVNKTRSFILKYQILIDSLFGQTMFSQLRLDLKES